MLFHVYDWIGNLNDILQHNNYTIHTSGLYCAEATESSPIIIFSRDELIEMDEHADVGRLIGLCGAIGLLTCVCSVMAFKLASQTRYYAIFQPKPEQEEGIPPEYTQSNVEV